MASTAGADTSGLRHSQAYFTSAGRIQFSKITLESLSVLMKDSETARVMEMLTCQVGYKGKANHEHIEEQSVY